MIEHDGRCPRCDVVLSGHPVRGVFPLQCPMCQGTFFRGNDLPQAVGAAVSQVSSAELFRPSEDLAQCPVGCGPMRRAQLGVRHRPLELDVCRTCGGAWFDAGELAALLALEPSAWRAPAGQVIQEQAAFATEERQIADQGQGEGLPGDVFAIFTGLPVEGDNPVVRFPWLTWALVVACVVVYFAERAYGRAFDVRWALVRATFVWSDDWLRLVTSMFLHGSLGHLAGNMYFLKVFGDNVEDRLGRLRFLAFYGLGGLAADGALMLSDPDSRALCLGASGAIAALLGGYLVLFPHVRFRVPVGGAVLPAPAYSFLLFWIGWQWMASYLWPDVGVAWMAHVGGFAAGVAMALVARFWVPDARFASSENREGLRRLASRSPPRDT